MPPLDDQGIRFLTFDCYGTLVEWRNGIESNFREFFGGREGEVFTKYVALEAGEENTYSSYKEILRNTSLRLAGELGFNPNPTSATKFADSITKWRAFPDSAPALKELGRKGYKRVILSNIDRDLLSETIRNNDLEVDGYITAQDVKSYKPAKNHWLRFFEEYGANKEEVLHVANSTYHDIIPATELGLRTVWVNRYNEDLAKDANPTYIVNGVSELLK